MRSDNAAVSHASIAYRSNFMSDGALKKWNVHQPETKNISGKHVEK